MPNARRKSLPPTWIPSLRDAVNSNHFAAVPPTLKSSAEASAYGAAIMSALCIREMSGHRAAAHTGAGFKHGPNLDVDGSHVAIIFALGRVAALGIKLAEECNRRGGKVVLVSAEDHPATEKLFPVRIDAVPEPWEAHHFSAGAAGAHARHGGTNRLPPASAVSIRRNGAVV